MPTNNLTFVRYFVELRTYIIQNDVQTREIQKFAESHFTFHLATCCYDFKERVRKKVVEQDTGQK